MSWNPVPVNLTVGNPPRGTGTQEARTFGAQSVSLTFALGLQPGSATVVYAGGASPVTQGAEVELVVGTGDVTQTLWGVCIQDVAEASTRGITRTLRFEDFRHYLQWDDVFCAFNQPEVRLVGTAYVKRYWHIYPGDYTAWRKTYTNAPLTAAQILDALFGAPTVGSPWVRVYHSDQSSYPVYELDFLAGEKLGSAVQMVSDKQGLVFCVQGGAYRLVWYRKGDGAAPVFPAKTDDQKVGFALSGHPSRVRVIGDRNLYQVMDMTMVKDWAAAWEVWWDTELFVEWVYKNGVNPATGVAYVSTPSDPEQYIGRQLARAQALAMTVGDVVALTGNTDYADYRMFAGRGRMAMPAVLYINRIVFRAFRPVDGFTFLNRSGDSPPMDSVVIADRLLCRVSHDPATGDQTYYTGEPMDGNGYAVAQGYQIGLDAFRTIRPEQFNVAQWSSQQTLWQHVPFQIDDSGMMVRFIIFDEPVIQSSDLVVMVDGKAVFKANPTLTVPTVRATLTLEAEKYVYTAGTGSKDDREVVSGLRGEYVSDVDESLTEVLYASGASVDSKASAIANSLLLRQWWYYEGGVKYVNGVLGAQLSGIVDRVTVEVNTQNGTYEQVDFTNERRHNAFVPEREFERRTIGNSWFPGQSELREQANQARMLASGFRQNPKFAAELTKALHGQIGSGEPTVPVVIVSGTGTLAVGTPLWKLPTDSSGAVPLNTLAVMPSAVGTAHSVFVGVTVRDGEDATSPLRVQEAGVALARVMGPVGGGDGVGRSVGNDYLAGGGDVGVGVAMEANAGTTVKLIRVRIGMGAGGGGAPVWL